MWRSTLRTGITDVPYYLSQSNLSARSDSLGEAVEMGIVVVHTIGTMDPEAIASKAAIVTEIRTYGPVRNGNERRSPFGEDVGAKVLVASISTSLGTFSQPGIHVVIRETRRDWKDVCPLEPKITGSGRPSGGLEPLQLLR